MPTPVQSAVVASPSPVASVLPVKAVAQPSPTPSPVPSPPVAMTPATTEWAKSAVPAIERPFGSHVGLSFRPVSYGEGFGPTSVSSQATVYTSFGLDGSWRAMPQLDVAGSYLFNTYTINRGTLGQGGRVEQHGRVMGYYVWPLMPQLELGAGAGLQIGAYGAADMPLNGRTPDLYDAPYQRLMADVEAKVAFRPVAAWPLTLSAGLSGLPFGAPFQTGTSIPSPLWGLGWRAGARYTVSGFAIETGYQGQRVFGTGYTQSSDLLFGKLGYYFN
ncbi:MAG: hypothetical protein H7338_08590 [Candidatus Sericytochromatia bacterium]|nr:hypothetical protein [Candidatus Sericytochromatia bacterium]